MKILYGFKQLFRALASTLILNLAIRKLNTSHLSFLVPVIISGPLTLSGPEIWAILRRKQRPDCLAQWKVSIVFHSLDWGSLLKSSIWASLHITANSMTDLRVSQSQNAKEAHRTLMEDFRRVSWQSMTFLVLLLWSDLAYSDSMMHLVALVMKPLLLKIKSFVMFVT